MTLETEIKFSVKYDFEIPDQRISSLGFVISERETVTTCTRYLDTPSFQLISCGAALRFRRRLDTSTNYASGVWTLKFAPPQDSHLISRDEYESYGEESSIPRLFTQALLVFGVGIESVSEIAILEAKRNSIIFSDKSGSKVFRIDDDNVTVISGENPGTSFREIELEQISDLFESFQLELTNIMIDEGARLAESSSKLEQALVDQNSKDRFQSISNQYDAFVVGDLCSFARIPFENVKSTENFSSLLANLFINELSRSGRIALAVAINNHISGVNGIGYRYFGDNQSIVNRWLTDASSLLRNSLGRGSVLSNSSDVGSSFEGFIPSITYLLETSSTKYVKELISIILGGVELIEIESLLSGHLSRFVAEG